MKKMNQDEMLHYVIDVVKKYDKKEDTSHVLFDFLVDTPKLIDFLQLDVLEPFYIAIRQSGCECGKSEYVEDRLKHLGEPIHVIQIRWERNLTLDYDFIVNEF